MAVAQGTVGQVVVTCPACGSSLEVTVQISEVHVQLTQLLVRFAGRFVEHNCTGRHG